jgi:hypothetical protein
VPQFVIGFDEAGNLTHHAASVSGAGSQAERKNRDAPNAAVAPVAERHGFAGECAVEPFLPNRQGVRFQYAGGGLASYFGGWLAEYRHRIAIDLLEHALLVYDPLASRALIEQ